MPPPEDYMSDDSDGYPLLYAGRCARLSIVTGADTEEEDGLSSDDDRKLPAQPQTQTGTLSRMFYQQEAFHFDSDSSGVSPSETTDESPLPKSQEGGIQTRKRVPTNRWRPDHAPVQKKRPSSTKTRRGNKGPKTMEQASLSPGLAKNDPLHIKLPKHPPKQLEDGTFAKPKGAMPKGYDWNEFHGHWESLLRAHDDPVPTSTIANVTNDPQAVTPPNPSQNQTRELNSSTCSPAPTAKSAKKHPPAAAAAAKRTPKKQGMTDALPAQVGRQSTTGTKRKIPSDGANDDSEAPHIVASSSVASQSPTHSSGDAAAKRKRHKETPGLARSTLTTSPRLTWDQRRQEVLKCLVNRTVLRERLAAKMDAAASVEPLMKNAQIACYVLCKPAQGCPKYDTLKALIEAHGGDPLQTTMDILEIIPENWSDIKI